jgi:chromate transport protein ChrA
MFLTIMSAICLISLGMAGFLGWDRLETEGTPIEMLMPVFFGGALLICVAFSRQHYRHGLYGGVLIAMMGVVSAIVRIYQYEQFQSIADPKTRLILAMGGICVLQMVISWREVQKDREVAPPL